MEAVTRLGDGVDAGAAVDGAEVEGGARFVGERSCSNGGKGCSECRDGVGRAGVGEAVAAGSGDGDLKTSAAKGLGNGGVSSCAVEDDVSGDAAGVGAGIVEMAHAAEIAFAFFAHVSEDDERDGQLDLRVDERVGEGEQTGEAGSVVAGAGRVEAENGIFSGNGGNEGRGGGEDGIEMRGEDDDGAAALGGKLRGRDDGDDIADGVGGDGGQAGFFEEGGDGAAAGVFTEGRSGNGDQLGLPVHDGLRDCCASRQKRHGPRAARRGR